MHERFAAQLEFICEIDKLKSVIRRTMLMDGARCENDAEHSWQLAVMALVLHEYAAEEVCLDRAIKMALVHDLVEIDAGDTFAFDEKGHLDKSERESLAAQRVFGLLPRDQGQDLRGLWEEFEAMETPDARFAAAMDRLAPFIHNTRTNGYSWKMGNVTKEQVYRRVGLVQSVCPGLWGFVEDEIAKAIEKGYIRG